MRVHKLLEFAVSHYTYTRFVMGLYSIFIKLKKNFIKSQQLYYEDKECCLEQYLRMCVCT